MSGFQDVIISLLGVPPSVCAPIGVPWWVQVFISPTSAAWREVPRGCDVFSEQMLARCCGHSWRCCQCRGIIVWSLSNAQIIRPYSILPEKLAFFRHANKVNRKFLANRICIGAHQRPLLVGPETTLCLIYIPVAHRGGCREIQSMVQSYSCSKVQLLLSMMHLCHWGNDQGWLWGGKGYDCCSTIAWSKRPDL